MADTVTAEPGMSSPFTQAVGAQYARNSSSVSLTRESEELWSDAPETADESHGIQVEGRFDNDELDEEDRLHSASVPGIDFDRNSHKLTDSSGKDASTNVITASLEQPPSELASPVDSDSHVATNGNRDYHPPPSQSTPELPANTSSATAPRSTQSLDVFQQYSNDRATSPTPTYNSTGVDRRNSHRRSAVDGRSNRISGFFSHFINRRPEREIASSTPISNRQREERDLLSTPKGSSRASSPAPTGHVTPPPRFPSPSLQELGLSLTAITAQLAPSHFSTPPISGTFLNPHYLLLCHSQGLDVLPLVAPPAPQPYALVRRVGFKSVVVMEQRGVLVAIAGRRDGVRVYALEEVKRAVEWRVDVEIRREKERLRREEAKKGGTGGVDKVFENLLFNPDYGRPGSSPLTPTPVTKSKRKNSVVQTREGMSAPALPLPRAPTTRRQKKRHAHHDSDPPPYSSSPRPQLLQNQPSAISVNQARSRSGSVSNVLAGTSTRRRSSVVPPPISLTEEDAKADWEHTSSDDEAINMVSAGASGSAALDERTSSLSPATRAPPESATNAVTLVTELGTAQSDTHDVVDSLRRSSTSTTTQSINRRNRPPQLELSRATSITNTASVTRPPPSPTPTIWTLRQALCAVPPGEGEEALETPDMDGDVEEEEEEGGDSVSFAQMLMESRLPDLPPPGTRVAQEAIMIDVGNGEARSSTPTSSIAHSRTSTQAPSQSPTSRSRRRWSILDGVRNRSTTDLDEYRNVSGPFDVPSRPDAPNSTSSIPPRRQSVDVDATSDGRPSIQRSFSSHVLTNGRREAGSPAPLPQNSTPTTPTHHRFLPRIITNALTSRRFDDSASTHSKSMDAKRQPQPSLPPIPPAPKLEYIKLPGTKGSVMIKAVETAKKSFLAILCGEGGDKVELFAGTYRTSLGLSRTFLLPDPPKSFELQLQGDDLVEIYLIFPQSVFGLEPATVRVREIRIGRAERRAARRRARENRLDLTGVDPEGPALGDEENPVNVRVGVTFSTASGMAQGADDGARTPPISRQLSETNITPSELQHTLGTPGFNNEDSGMFRAAPLPPYTTFQQLSFAPKFPLPVVAEDFIIPPTYLSFLEYRAEHEPEAEGTNNLDLANVQFTPPGLPVPPALPPSKWYYCDPKGTIQGPWKASLMQTWYKDGLLPPDLPVRREEEIEFVLLKDLRAQSVDPSHPFRSPPPPLNNSMMLPSEPAKPLLDPISLLTQAKYYGPPALFFTTRGGHSTSIVDARGRSVLKGRLHWSTDDDDDFSLYRGRLGDVTRLEAFDAADKALIVAIRQGGLEVADVGDAILKPGDLSRPVLPTYNPKSSAFNRRKAFTWRVGSPLSHFATGPISSVSFPLPKDSLMPHKKSSLPPGKSPAKSDFPGNDDYDGRAHEELLYLGRHEEDVYCCERTSSSFRILRLCPIPS